MLGISEKETKSAAFLNIFIGNQLIENTTPYAMCYGGHQFGHWAGQLGDGRAINLGEIIHNEQQWVIQLKGSGITPYSRAADSLTELRTSVREYFAERQCCNINYLFYSFIINCSFLKDKLLIFL